MAHDQLTREELLARLSHQPRHIMKGMIQVSKPVTVSSVERCPHPSASLGRLDSLPIELLHGIFSMLDLQTLSRITRTCLRGTAVVPSLLEYRDLLRHAPRAMAALGSTKLIRYHSASTLHAALASSKCSSCGEYGAFLFLPTCERCCYGCLWGNQSLWVIPISQARRCFDLSAASMKQLPTMSSLPGKYHVRYDISRKRSIRLVSVRAAKELAVKENKSGDYLAAFVEDKLAGGLPRREYHTLRWLQAAPLHPPGPEPALRSTQANVPSDKFCGMASVEFPSLLPDNRSSAENGLWCLGCEKSCRDWSPEKSTEEMSRLAARGGHVKFALHERQEMARSEAGFLQHLSHCTGAKEMVPDLEEKLRQILPA